MTSLLNAALIYADRGWYILPLQPEQKVPATEHGFQDATLDEAIIRDWWLRNPHYNIGIATGAASNLTVIDVDGAEGIASSQTIADQIPQTRVIKTPHGYHLYFLHNLAFHTGAGFMPGLDLRSDGGYVVAPPSVVNGVEYKLLRDKELVALTIVPDVFISRNRNGTEVELPPPTWVSEALANGAPEGQRNDLTTRLAGYFHGKNVPADIIEQLLTPFAEKCSPPLPIRELSYIIQSVGRYGTSPDSKWDISGTSSGTSAPNGEPQNTKRDTSGTLLGTSSLASVVQAWVEGSQGWCTADELDREIGITLPADRENRRKILTRLAEQGIIERNPRKNREFRKRDRTLSKMDFRNVKRTGGLDIRFPLEIEKLVRLYPGNLVVVGGDGNVGKTAFMLNIVRYNSEKFDIHYFNSEMAEEELRIRLDLFRDMEIDDWDFLAYDRVRDFADVIVPDAINIIDFLEMTDDFHLAGKYLSEIWEKLGKGIGIVALQKKLGHQLAKGAEATMDRARLYVSISDGKLTIVKGKNPADEKVNPNGLSIRFKLEMGAYFIPQGEWTHEGDDDR